MKANIEELRRKAIFHDINDERTSQDIKWGEQNHNPFIWDSILGEEVGEVSKAILESKLAGVSEEAQNIREELIQVAAVAVAMIECGDRNDWWKT